MKYNILYLFFILSCNYSPQEAALSPVKTLSNSEFNAEKSAFLKTPCSDDKNAKCKLDGNMRFNVKNTAMWNLQNYPIAPFVADYGEVSNTDIIIAVKFPRSFISNVPRNIRNHIANFDIKDIEIFFIVQAPTKIGSHAFGTKDQQGIGITQLWANLWADPDAPMMFDDWRFDRKLLMGIFDADKKIEYQLKNNALNYFSVINHGNKISPSTAKIKVDAFKQLSFWSLVIDKQEKRAAITLHWLFNDSNTEFLDPFLDPDPDNTQQANSFADLITKLKKVDELKDSALLKKLNVLVATN
jgi:hypothetical protein